MLALVEVDAAIVAQRERPLLEGSRSGGLQTRTIEVLDQRSVGEGHPLLGRRMPDLDIVTGDGPLRVFELLHKARPRVDYALTALGQTVVDGPLHALGARRA